MNGIHHQVAAAYEGRTEEGRVDVSLSLLFGIWAYFFTYHLLPCLLNFDDSIEHDVAASALHSFSDLIRQQEFLSEDSQRYVRPVKRNKTVRADRRHWKMGYQKASKEWKVSASDRMKRFGPVSWHLYRGKGRVLCGTYSRHRIQRLGI